MNRLEVCSLSFVLKPTASSLDFSTNLYNAKAEYCAVECIVLSCFSLSKRCHCLPAGHCLINLLYQGNNSRVLLLLTFNTRNRDTPSSQAPAIVVAAVAATRWGCASIMQFIGAQEVTLVSVCPLAASKEADETLKYDLLNK